LGFVRKVFFIKDQSILKKDELERLYNHITIDPFFYGKLWKQDETQSTESCRWNFICRENRVPMADVAEGFFAVEDSIRVFSLPLTAWDLGGGPGPIWSNSNAPNKDEVSIPVFSSSMRKA
jgi:hypothetical protein